MGLWKIFIGFLTFVALVTAVLVVVIARYIALNYSLTDEQRSESRKTKFCIVSAGVSGICVGYVFKLMDLDFVIIEKA